MTSHGAKNSLPPHASCVSSGVCPTRRRAVADEREEAGGRPGDGDGRPAATRQSIGGRVRSRHGRQAVRPIATAASQPTGKTRNTPWMRVSAASAPRSPAQTQCRSRAATIVHTARPRNSASVNGANRKKALGKIEMRTIVRRAVAASRSRATSRYSPIMAPT